MRDLLDALDEQLTTIAAAPDRGPVGASTGRVGPQRRSPRSRWRLFTGSGLAAGGAVVAVFGLTGTSTAGLPIFATPSTDATAIRAFTPNARGIDFERAHSFRTSGGPGYAFESPAGGAVCLVVPDPRGPGSYGSSCSPSRAAVEREGLLLEISSGPTSTGSRVTFLLPEHAEDPRVSTPDGRPVRAVVSHGIVSADLAAGGHIAWTRGAQHRQRTVYAPRRAPGRALVMCPDGQQKTVNALPDASGDKARRALHEARRKACG